MPLRPLGKRWGALVMDSMPPATTMVACPEESSSAAIIVAFMPEPHILLTVVAGVALSRPAPNAAWRAGAWPWPAPSTLPKIRSSTSSGFTPACSMAALMATEPSCEAVTLPNLPCMEPIGVRFAPTITMLSAIAISWSNRFFEQLAPDQHAADLVGARADVVELRVAQQARGGVLARGAPAALVERLRGAIAEGARGLQ